MGTLNDFAFKQRKYMPVFPKATGKPTIYIEGYPYEDDEPMPATEFHAEQVRNLADQLTRYFAIHPHVHIGVDTFVYYREGDMTKFVAPDVHVVLGAAKFPLRRSFYTWSEGAVPAVIFEFLSDATADQDRDEKVQVYLRDMGAQEYFIHQPEMEKPPEFRGWRRDLTADIVEITPDTQEGLFSETLNLYFRWEDQHDTQVRLLRPYLPDGTPITTSMEEHSLRIEAETRAVAAETRAAAAEQERQEMEAELKRLRQQLAHRQDNDIS
ncbi:MAG: Uma2 family endonuclease [Candidatus Poribacteria bacterium]|nr:Uma2 family endonuclease [Candidatus Poribacteria bacterium]MDE0465661.1 Uma2 family endonuclease [Candidatus Poribacteria bacterium]